MGENVAMLHFVHVLDLSAAADDAGKHKHVCGDIVMTQAVSIRLKASWRRSAGVPGRQVGAVKTNNRTAAPKSHRNPVGGELGRQ